MRCMEISIFRQPGEHRRTCRFVDKTATLGINTNMHCRTGFSQHFLIYAGYSFSVCGPRLSLIFPTGSIFPVRQDRRQ